MRRKSPRSDGRKTVVNGIEGVHTTDSIGYSAGYSDKEIGAPEIMRRGVDARVQFSQFQTRSFRCEEFLFTNPQSRQERERKEYDAHSSYPVRHTAPEQNRVRQSVNVGKSRRARSGKSRHRFEKSFRNPMEMSAKEEGKHTQSAIDEPDHCYNEKAISAFKSCGTFSAEQSQNQTQHSTNTDGNIPSAVVRFSITKANEPAHQEK